MGLRGRGYADGSLSSSRFLKSIVARHRNGPLVLKIFIKPDASMTLRVIQRRLKRESGVGGQMTCDTSLFMLVHCYGVYCEPQLTYRGTRRSRAHLRHPYVCQLHRDGQGGLPRQAVGRVKSVRPVEVRMRTFRSAADIQHTAVSHRH